MRSGCRCPPETWKGASISLWEAALILIAGMAAGTINTVVGSGTLITFPALVALGVPPVTANVSNTVGLFPGSLVGAWGYRKELVGQGRRIGVLGIASVLGAAVGAVLLLRLPSSAFDAIVPVLILLALVLVLFGKRLTAMLTRRSRGAGASFPRTLTVATAASGVYGGYFGAAQGVILMGLFGMLIPESIQRHNALKNLLAGLVNLVAAAVFVSTTHIDWTAAALIAVGSIFGGLLGARVGRRLSAPALRAVIVVIGLIAIIKLVW